MKRSALKALVLIVLAAAVIAPARAQEGLEKLVTPSLVADTSAVVPGKPFRLGVLMKMQHGWHTYYKESGEAGMPTKIEWQLPPGYKASEILWKKPHRFLDAGITTFGYKDQTLLGATITPPANAPTGSSVTFKAKVKWLACQDACVPGKREISMTIPTAAAAEPANAQLFEGLGWTGPVKDLPLDDPKAETPAEQGGGESVITSSGAAPASFGGNILEADLKVADSTEKKLSLPEALALAFLGGFILNFMPCVLPVISIKVLSFMQQAGDDPKRVFRLGLAFTAGIFSAFFVLALAVIGVQAAGQNIGWGFQMQYPVFLFAMAAIVLVFALSLFGLFYVQLGAGSGQIDKLASKEGYTGTFFKGVLATMLSTPCSAPFLGPAVGFGFTQPPYVVFLMFATIAVGMAFPYVLLTAKPAWMKYLPKPGVWMEKFKEAMGFLLLGTVVWLVSVLGQQVGVGAAIATVGFLVALSFAVWMIGRFTDLTSTNTRKSMVYALAALILVASYFTMLRPYPELLAFGAPQYQVAVDTTHHGGPYEVATRVVEGIDWQPFTVDRLNQELKAQKTVFVDFTADWCLTCKVNENTVLNTPEVKQKMRELKVVPLRADWTRQDAQIAALLHKFGRSGVPLYVIFPADRPTQPEILPEAITLDMVLQKLNEAGASH